MSDLWGIDCSYGDCRHDTVRAYRLRRWIRVNGDAWATYRARTQHMVLDATLPDAAPREMVNEEPDRIFRDFQLEVALNEMEALGAQKRTLGAFLVEDRKVLPPDAAARLVMLQAEPMPKTALYFRWDPGSGKQLMPENCFQLLFLPGSTVAERRAAPERRLSDEEFLYAFRRLRPDGYTTLTTNIKCQHCHRTLPIKAFNTLGLREVEKGD